MRISHVVWHGNIQILYKILTFYKQILECHLSQKKDSLNIMHYYKKVHSFGNQRTELKVHRRIVAMKPVLDAPLGTVNLNFQSSTPALTN